MPKRENVATRRQHVYKLAMLEGRSVPETAGIMKQKPKTIENDLAYLQKQTRQSLQSQDPESFLSGLIGNTMATRTRVMAYLQMDDLPHTARANYEKILLDCDDRIEKRFTKLAGTGANEVRGLEDSLAAMSFEAFNRFIGLPYHPNTLLPCELTAAQMDVFKAIPQDGRVWLHLVKSRQIGMSELILRALVYLAFSKYRGKKIAIVAGTRIETAGQLFTRLQGLLKPIATTVSYTRSDMIKLKNGTEFHLTPSSQNSMNGWEKVGAVLLDESAFWGLQDDHVILNTFLPFLRSSGGDCFAISNPNAPAGYFYHIWKAASPEWKKMEIDIHAGGQELYSKDEIQNMIESSSEDPASSYLCKFVGGRDSIFGDLDEKDITAIYEAVSFD